MRFPLNAVVGAFAVTCLSGVADAQQPSRPVNQDAARLFRTESDARAWCGNDFVVWLNTHTGVFHFRGSEWYGRTANGAFACRAEVERRGARPSLSRDR